MFLSPALRLDFSFQDLLEAGMQFLYFVLKFVTVILVFL